MTADSSSQAENSPRAILIEKKLTEEIIGSFFTVYNETGFGFLESIYSRALEIELKLRGLRVERELPTPVIFRGVEVGLHRIDMLVEGRVIVEIKATHGLPDIAKRQLLNYVRALEKEVGLLLHFGPKPAFQRVVYTWKRPGR